MNIQSARPTSRAGRGLGALLGAAILAAGCGDVINPGAGDGGIDGAIADAGPDAPVGPDCTADEIPLADVEACFRQELCTAVVDCGFLISFVDMNECVEHFSDVFFNFERILQTAIAGIEAGRITYDGAAVAACFDGFAQCNLGADACNQFQDGDTPDDGECFLDGECGAGGRCSGNSGCPEGQCCAGACQRPAGLDESCADNQRCEAGLHCVTDLAGAQVCLAGEVGDRCNTTSDCDDVNFCAPDSTCQPRKGETAACEQTAECQFPLRCVANTCQRPDAVGDPCDNVCIGQLFCDNGLCARLPGLNQSCAESNICLGVDLFCNDGVCQARGDVDDPCTGSASCRPDLFCDPASDTCQALRANGQVCGSDLECQSRVCGGGAAALTCQPVDLCYD
jgi:hypothetical protein